MLEVLAALMVASAPMQSSDQTIWRDISVGMTGQQLEAAYPERIPNPNRPGKAMRANYYFGGVIRSADSVQIIGRCHADYRITYPANVVTEVEVSGTGNCNHHELYGALIAKYGQPIESREITNQTGLTMFDRTVETRWIDRAVMVSLIGTTITYTVIGDSSGL